jgi:hypothetical protein
MRSSVWIATIACAVLSTACATTIVSPPNRQLAEARAAVRVAEEVGAQNHPQAVWYLGLARHQMMDADYALAQTNYRGAFSSLQMAQANAELAAALAREANARAQAAAIRRQANALEARVPRQEKP